MSRQLIDLPSHWHEFRFRCAVTEQGSWYLAELTWKDHVICAETTAHFAAGWEVTLNGVRYTPHTGNAQALPATCSTEGGSLHLQLPHHLPGLCTLTHQVTFHELAFEQWVSIEYTGTATLHIENFNFAQLKLSHTFLRGLSVQSSDGYTVRDTVSQYFEADDPAVVLKHEDEHWGVALLNLAPGQMHRISTGTYCSVGYSNAKTPFRASLSSGEEFVSDKGICIPYQDHYQAPIYAYCRQYLRQQRPVPLLTSYCSWEPFGRDINEDRIRQQIDLAGKLGFECVILDDGWQDHSGDWQANPITFPNGLEPLVQHAQNLNIKLGLWISLASISRSSHTHAEHQDCLLLDEYGQTRSTTVAEGPLDIACLCTRYQDTILQRLDDLVTRYQLAYLKIDLPCVNDVYFKPALTCHQTGHQHEPGRDFYLKSYRAIQSIVGFLRAKHPRLLLDVTFELWGGWHLIDYGLISSADVCWMSNLGDAAESGDYGPMQARHLAAERSHLLPPEHCVIGNMRANGPYPVESLVSSFASFPMMLGDLSTLSASTIGALRHLLGWFQQQRERFDLCHYYAVLGSNPGQRPSQHAWSGFLRCDAQGQGILALFRNLSVHDTCSIAIQLPSTVPDNATLVLTSADGQSQQRTTARELRQGLPCHGAAQHDLLLFSLERT